MTPPRIRIRPEVQAMTRLGGIATVALVALAAAGCGGAVTEKPSDPCAELAAFRARLEALGCAAADLTETLEPTPQRSCEAILQTVAACVRDSECSAYPAATSCPTVTLSDGWEGP